MTMDHERADLAIVTATREELEPVLNLIGGAEHWEPFLIDNFIHHRARFEVDGAAPLRVVATFLWKYGSTPTTAEVIRLKAVAPRMITMTGICAGWESKDIAFGDLIIADRAYHSAEGKQVGAVLQPDIQTYQPEPWLSQWLQSFTDSAWISDVRTPRPRSLRYQMEWIVWRLASQTDLGLATWPADNDWSDIQRECPHFERARETLFANGLITTKGRLTHAGRQLFETLRTRRLGQVGPTPDFSEPRVRYGAFATHPAVIADKTFFAKQAKRVRKILAAEMEVASLFSAAAEIRTLAFAVKGVSDYGTLSKDDSFHSYAAEVSACWMRAFIRRHGAFLTRIEGKAERTEAQRPTDSDRHSPVPGIKREAASEILVVVAQFSGNAAYNPTDRVYSSQSGHVHEVIPGIGRVERIAAAPASKMEAVRAAGQYDASIVVWGTYDDFGITPRYEITRDSSIIRRSMIQLDQATRHHLRETFEPYITSALSDEMSFLSLLAVGHMCLLNLNSSAAVDVLQRAVSLVLDADRRSVLRVDQGYEALASAHLALHQYDEGLEANTRGLEINRDSITLLMQRIALLAAAKRTNEIEAIRERLLKRVTEAAPAMDGAVVELIRNLVSGKTPSDLRREVFKSQKEAFLDWQRSKHEGLYNKDAGGHLARAFATMGTLKFHETIRAADAAFRLNPLLAQACASRLGH
jgi:nucleoside phosphorylase/tetratricopeptide (TPR) repeat protein